jgi:uncharacterized protein YecT (DUF1311 family)
MDHMWKRVLFLTPVLILALLAVCEGHERSLEVLCPEATTTVEMQACLRQRYEAADKALNRVYKQLMSKLESGRREKLRAAQRAWIRFRDASAEFEAGEAEGGSMYPLVYMATQVLKTEHRVDELKEILRRLASK